MGRRRKGESKEMPLISIEVTEKQFALLAWVYYEGYKGVRNSRIRWSPTAYRGGELTNAEAATLSNRLKTLVERRFLDRDGTEVHLTGLGRDALEYFMRKRPEEVGKRIRERIELDSDVQLLGELHKVRDGFIRYRRASGLVKEEAELTLKHLDVLQKTVIKQVQKRLETIVQEIEEKLAEVN